MPPSEVGQGRPRVLRRTSPFVTFGKFLFERRLDLASFLRTYAAKSRCSSRTSSPARVLICFTTCFNDGRHFPAKFARGCLPSDLFTSDSATRFASHRVDRDFPRRSRRRRRLRKRRFQLFVSENAMK